MTWYTRGYGWGPVLSFCCEITYYRRRWILITVLLIVEFFWDVTLYACVIFQAFRRFAMLFSFTYRKSKKKSCSALLYQRKTSPSQMTWTFSLMWNNSHKKKIPISRFLFWILWFWISTCEVAFLLRRYQIFFETFFLNFCIFLRFINYASVKALLNRLSV